MYKPLKGMAMVLILYITLWFVGAGTFTIGLVKGRLGLILSGATVVLGSTVIYGALT